MRVKLLALTQACDITGVSDRNAAVLVNATLKDMGILTKKESSKVIDRNTIRRLRANGVHFDGRNDRTLIQITKGGESKRKTITEEHVVLVSKPGSLYLGHVTPNSGTSLEIRKSILDVMAQQSKMV
ncbi:hypothetical protein ILUMI_18375 [Ignelater luminosus]|uniref:Uncharacterized protein n=1 Tax=Ignelater luminosus TaxID=2038154 RepID=A0A8K0CI46_IGNLU|nr:hypothetical protein ILUMI_18375 [Ignelater luminosus]